MGNEWLRIADGFSMVAEGLRGLAGMEWNGAVDMAEKDAAVPESGVAVDGYGKGEAAVDAVETGAAEAGDSGSGKGQKAGEADKKAADSKKAVAIEGVRAVMAQKTQEGKSKEIKDLLQKYGAVKLSAVDPEHYPALLKEAGEL
ncbi:hypothetical protein IMSAGC020_02888 [Lachnospiraceae bacterium]|nr:hypothetical protein IMSAGC020_02888 [Lachnospiraceae bacterium]